MPHRLLLLLSLFALGPAGAWAWYHVGTRPPEVTYRIEPRAAVPGFEFIPQRVGDAALAILATTNLVNGDFVDGDRRITVFAADWKAETAQQMNVVAHTPDLCWVGSGFKPVDIGQPRMVDIDIGGTPVSFECRVFEVPGLLDHEMTLWCTLVGGRFVEEGFRFDGRIGFEDDSVRNQRFVTSRRRGANLFLRSLSERSPSDATKQFVRFSAPVRAGEAGPALEALADFARAWLRVEIRRRPSPDAPDAPDAPADSARLP